MALVRVKRRAQDDPVDLLLVACKKSKTDDSNEENSAEIEEKSTVFKFTATVPSEEPDEVKSHINRILSTDVKLPVKGRHNDVDSLLEKIRADNKSLSKNNRFKVVNCFRAVDTDFYAADPPSRSPQQHGKTLTIVDIESASTSPVTSSHEATKDSDNSEETSQQYVYDLYYSKVADFDDLLLDKMLSVHEVDESLLFDNDGSDEDENGMDDDDDSNDEGNWRNDYPDEDPDGDDDDDRSSRSSIGEEHMRLAARLSHVNLDGNYSSDLSSDREEEDLIYGEEDGNRYNSWVASDDD